MPSSSRRRLNVMRISPLSLVIRCMISRYVSRIALSSVDFNLCRQDSAILIIDFNVEIKSNKL